jgi:LmbE family N-acetylglucosaminyl deacetylase|tara:strand:+ start:448 stop:1089 length:642 start_codon:yes stop_codon:yes gene_type:complete
MNRDLHIVCAHLDDFEISCYGYIFKHHNRYENIYLHLATNNGHKEPITINNLNELSKILGRSINYRQHNFHSTRLRTEMDDLKDSIYTSINFKRNFDILCHDSNDLHTDHQVCYEIMMGLLKLSDRFFTYYSPSSINFEPNYFIELSEDQYKFKSKTISEYDIEKDQSYSKVGYYLNEHWNIGMAYVMENCAKYKSEYYDIYKIKKWTTNGVD